MKSTTYNRCIQLSITILCICYKIFSQKYFKLWLNAPLLFVACVISCLLATTCYTHYTTHTKKEFVDFSATVTMWEWSHLIFQVFHTEANLLKHRVFSMSTSGKWKEACSSAHLTRTLRSWSRPQQPAAGRSWRCRRCSSCPPSWWGWCARWPCRRRWASSRCSTGSCPTRCSRRKAGSGGGRAASRSAGPRWRQGGSPGRRRRAGTGRGAAQAGHCWRRGSDNYTCYN